MPKYYCDYCDAFLTHDSPKVRNTHNTGRKHKENVRMFYQGLLEKQAQKLVDATAKAFMKNRLTTHGRPIASSLFPPISKNNLAPIVPTPMPIRSPIVQTGAKIESVPWPYST